MRRRVVQILLVLALAVVGRWFGHQAPGALVLWAWERPTDLRFLPAGSWVAPLVAHVHLRGHGFQIEGRKQPLKLPAQASVLPVIRIESDGAAIEADPAKLAAVIVDWTAFPRSQGLQIDFDARLSERPFYTQLLSGIRRRLGPGRRLSITALASWCLDDSWIAALPIDEAVPMLFQMGPDTATVRRRLAAGEDFRLAVCRLSVGWSTAEQSSGRYDGRRLYLFSPERWSKEQLARARAQWLD